MLLFWLAGNGHEQCHVWMSTYILIDHTMHLHLTTVAHGVLVVWLLLRCPSTSAITATTDVGVPSTIGYLVCLSMVQDCNFEIRSHICVFLLFFSWSCHCLIFRVLFVGPFRLQFYAVYTHVVFHQFMARPVSCLLPHIS